MAENFEMRKVMGEKGKKLVLERFLRHNLAREAVKILEDD
jgi:hypothetical protein